MDIGYGSAKKARTTVRKLVLVFPVIYAIWVFSKSIWDDIFKNGAKTLLLLKPAFYLYYTLYITFLVIIGYIRIIWVPFALFS